MLSPTDLVVLLGVAVGEDQKHTYASLAKELCLSPSEVHSSVKRSRVAHLMSKHGSAWRLNRSALLEFLLHGARYAFAVEPGPLTRGIPTAYAAPPLRDLIAAGSEPPPVWPHPKGTVRGFAISPLHKRAPDACMQSPRLYELLSLTDSLRIGNARERNLAAKEFTARLESSANAES